MDDWQQCVDWLIRCKQLSTHFSLGGDLRNIVHALRDGVVLCNLLHSIKPGCFNNDDIVFIRNPKNSETLCLKNIEAFLAICSSVFHLRDLFAPRDLYDGDDLTLVLNCLSALSNTSLAIERCGKGFQVHSRHNRHTVANLDDDRSIYMSTTTSTENEEIYNDLMKLSMGPATSRTKSLRRSATVKKRSERLALCSDELLDTELTYIEGLKIIMKDYNELKPFFNGVDIFGHIEKLVETHEMFYKDLVKAKQTRSFKMLGECFLKWKLNFTCYGHYCSDLPKMKEELMNLEKCNSQFAHKLKTCSEQSKKSSGTRFGLLELLSVPFQRVLKYHLLLQTLFNLVPKQQSDERKWLKEAMEAMKDIGAFVNAVQSDSESIAMVEQIHNRIIGLEANLQQYGRLQKDGELKICSTANPTLKLRCVFLFDRAMIICKNLQFKQVIDLNYFHLDLTNELAKHVKDRWSFGFTMRPTAGVSYSFFSKSDAISKTWVEAIQMAFDNTRPQGYTQNEHLFVATNFTDVQKCSRCRNLLRGYFFSGYKCQKCNNIAHKECLPKLAPCSIAVNGTESRSSPNAPRRHSSASKQRVSSSKLPHTHGVTITQRKSSRCAPPPLVPVEAKPKDLSSYPWYAGSCSREEAIQTLMFRDAGTYLVRWSEKFPDTHSLSFVFNGEVNHIRIKNSGNDGSCYVMEDDIFSSLHELIEFYQLENLKYYFPDMDTTLRTPYKHEVTNLPGSGSHVIVNCDYSPCTPFQLPLLRGDIIRVLEKPCGDAGWWKGELNGRIGYFLSSFVSDYNEFHSEA